MFKLAVPKDVCQTLSGCQDLVWSVPTWKRSLCFHIISQYFKHYIPGRCQFSRKSRTGDLPYSLPPAVLCVKLWTTLEIQKTSGYRTFAPLQKPVLGDKAMGNSWVTLFSFTFSAQIEQYAGEMSACCSTRFLIFLLPRAGQRSMIESGRLGRLWILMEKGDTPAFHPLAGSECFITGMTCPSKAAQAPSDFQLC